MPLISVWVNPHPRSTHTQPHPKHTRTHTHAHLQVCVCVVARPIECEVERPLPRRLCDRGQVWPRAKDVDRHVVPRGVCVLRQALQQLGVALGPKDLAQEVGALCLFG